MLGSVHIFGSVLRIRCDNYDPVMNFVNSNFFMPAQPITVASGTCVKQEISIKNLRKLANVKTHSRFFLSS